MFKLPFVRICYMCSYLNIHDKISFATCSRATKQITRNSFTLQPLRIRPSNIRIMEYCPTKIAIYDDIILPRASWNCVRELSASAVIRGISQLHNLRNLHISRLLPEVITTLTRLTYLRICGIEPLRQAMWFPKSIQSVEIECYNTECITSFIKHVPHITSLTIRDTTEHVDISSLRSLTSLKLAYVNINSIPVMPSLKSLELIYDQSVKYITDYPVQWLTHLSMRVSSSEFNDLMPILPQLKKIPVFKLDLMASHYIPMELYPHITELSVYGHCVTISSVMQMPNLKVLKFEFEDDDDDTEFCIKDVTAIWPKLDCINVEGSLLLTKDLLRILGPGHWASGNDGLDIRLKID